MNQSLEGHNGSVVNVTWNPIYRKLTTSDESGLIMVWILHKGVWCEEMINNRNKSVVRDMKWTADGRKIAIVYEDGAVIVGSVDGNRLWGKDLPFPLRFVEWSPDGNLLLFVTLEAEVYIYDADGNKIRNFPLIGQDNTGLGGDTMITSIHWHCPTNVSQYQSGQNKNNGDLPSTLAIAFADGKIQLSRADDERTAEILDTDLATIDHIRWSSKGQYLAVIGRQRPANSNVSSKNESKSSGSTTNIVKFFDNYGKFIRNLKIPGENIREVSWEGGDLRLALAVDSFVYFANIRHRYLWTYFNNTVVYSHSRPERRESTLVFWDLISNETYLKQVQNLKFLVSSGEYCAVIISEKVSKLSLNKQKRDIESNTSGRNEGKDRDEEENQSPTNNNAKGGNNDVLIDVYSVQLRNSIGALVDVKPLTFIPKYIAMNAGNILIANDRVVYTWQYLVSSSSGGSKSPTDEADDLPANDMMPTSSDANAFDLQQKSKRLGKGKQRIFDICNVTMNNAQSPETFKVLTESIPDPISSVAISDKFVMIGKKDGSLVRFNLPHLTPENTYQLRDKEPMYMQFNCTSTKLSVIDTNGIFTVYDLEYKVPNNKNENDEENSQLMDQQPTQSSKSSRNKNASNASANNNMYISASFGKKMNIERKDVWDMIWSSDDPDMFAIMEKTKLVVFQNETPEDPVVSSAYLCTFEQFELKLIALDVLFQSPDKINPDYLIMYESKILRDLREKIAGSGLNATYDYLISQQLINYPRLWKLLAISALEENDLAIAEKALIQLKDYAGLQMITNCLQMKDTMKIKAEIFIYLNKFSDAELIYHDIDRKDLAISLNKKICNHQQVVKLLKSGGGNDKDLIDNYNEIGYYYYDHMKWKKAIPLFQLSNNLPYLVDCYYRMEQYKDIVDLLPRIREETPYLLYSLSKQFESVGMCNESVQCYLDYYENQTSAKGTSSMTSSTSTGMRLPSAAISKEFSHQTNNIIKEAIDCCVKFNQWDKALELAEKYEFPQVESLLIKYAMQLLNNNRKLQAIELFRVANKPTETAILIGDLAETVITNFANPLLAKKLYILAALEIERHRKRAIDQATQQTAEAGGNNTNIAQATAHTLETLMMTPLLEGGGTQINTLGGTLQMTLNTLTTQAGATTINTKKVSRAFANAWRGAAAYHYYMLASRQFYAGNHDAAMKSSIKLCEYDDIISPKIIYSLLCLASLKNKFYGVCSKAFVKVIYSFNS